MSDSASLELLVKTDCQRASALTASPALSLAAAWHLRSGLVQLAKATEPSLIPMYSPSGAFVAPIPLPLGGDDVAVAVLAGLLPLFKLPRMEGAKSRPAINKTTMSKRIRPTLRGL